VARGVKWNVPRRLWRGFSTVAMYVIGREEAEVMVRSSKRKRARRVR